MVQAERGPGSQTVPSATSPPPPPRSRAVWCSNSGCSPRISTPLLGCSPWNRRTSDSRVGDQVSLQRWDLCGLFPAKPLSFSGLLPGVGQAQAELGPGKETLKHSPRAGLAWLAGSVKPVRPGCSALETPPPEGPGPGAPQDQRMGRGALSHGSEQGALVGGGPGKRYDVSWACQPLGGSWG